MTNLVPVCNHITDPSQGVNDPNASKALPAFSRYPSMESMCYRNSTMVKNYCAQTNLPPANCQMHDADPFPPPQPVRIVNSTGSPFSSMTGIPCKTLWFSGIHENDSCEYKKFYAAALNSAMHNARDILQPVILLGRKGNMYENSTDNSKFGDWAKDRGAVVVNIPFLSFQELVDQKYKHDLNIQGAFLRLEIPRIVKEHNLMNSMPDICQQYVLYTDVDVLFPNKLTHDDILLLKDTLSTSSGGGAYVMYGREFSKDPHIMNTGVMMFDIEKFGNVIPKILDLATQKDYDTADQGMINNYFTQNKRTNKERTMLPIHYNWKAYWKLELSSFQDVKIYHHHGPKPGKCLEIMSDCNVDMIGKLGRQYEPYAEHIRQGICCDAGRTARWALEASRAFATNSISNVC